LGGTGASHKTRIVLVTFGIVKVTFADGSTWSDNGEVEYNSFDGNLYEKQEGCHSPTVSEVQKKRS
jgi:hypothetical protein